ncbi:hypothetical protein TNCV_1717121 [Trichonephila clavipes]|nr:hypothetical protein TNCV_1717121 [Trichonephila clavipes]
MILFPRRIDDIVPEDVGATAFRQILVEWIVSEYARDGARTMSGRFKSMQALAETKILHSAHLDTLYNPQRISGFQRN